MVRSGAALQARLQHTHEVPQQFLLLTGQCFPVISEEQPQLVVLEDLGVLRHCGIGQVSRGPEQVHRRDSQGMRESLNCLPPWQCSTRLDVRKKTVADSNLSRQLSLRQWWLYCLSPSSDLCPKLGMPETAHQGITPRLFCI